MDVCKYVNACDAYLKCHLQVGESGPQHLPHLVLHALCQRVCVFSSLSCLPPSLLLLPYSSSSLLRLCSQFGIFCLLQIRRIEGYTREQSEREGEKRGWGCGYTAIAAISTQARTRRQYILQSYKLTHRAIYMDALYHSLFVLCLFLLAAYRTLLILAVCARRSSRPVGHTTHA